MGEKKLEGAGLRGQVAGNTALSTVGKTGKGLTYRGYAIEELAEKATFEEVAYMLLYGKCKKPRSRGLRSCSWMESIQNASCTKWGYS